LADGVVRHEVRDDGLVATLFVPPGDVPHPVILVVPGSDGGIPEHIAALYASHGYGALALAYFAGGEPELAPLVPATLAEIPLEYFETALAWIARHPSLDHTRLTISGTSRGGELALLLASRYDQIRAVIAWVPSSHVYSSMQVSSTGTEPPAWTHGGRPLPHISVFGNGAASSPRPTPNEFDTRDGAAIGSLAHLRRLREDPSASQAEIAVERINGPVLLISGRDDTLWPSAAYSDWVVGRLRRNEFPHEVLHVSYENAGHTVGPPLAPATLNRLYWHQPGSDAPPHELHLGGTPQGIAAARADLWPRVLAFLHTHTSRHLQESTHA
jgi:dienelactone hydrolase